MGTFWEDSFWVCCFQDMTAFVTDVFQDLWKPRQHYAPINDAILGNKIVRFQVSEGKKNHVI